MKKLFYISLILVTVFAVSCKKENIEPKNQNNQEQDCTCNNTEGKSSNTCKGNSNEILDPITDPNNDEDENKPKRRKISDSNS